MGYQPRSSGGGGGSSPVGSIMSHAGPDAPAGWLLCDGAEVSRGTYSALFAAIGEAYGAGDGSTTFLLPDLRDRVPAGVGPDHFPMRGYQTGEASHALDFSNAEVFGGSASPQNVQAGGDFSVYATGSGAPFPNASPHNNIQPSLAVHFIIKT